MKNSVLVLPAIAGTLCCLAGQAIAQTASTSNRAPVVIKNVVTEGVSFADNCGTAGTVGDGTYSYDLSGATNDYSASCGSSASAADMWIAYTAPVTGLATATTCGLATSDSVLSVVDGCGGGEIVCVDDSCAGGGVQSTVTWAITAGTTYYVRVAGYNGNVHAGQVQISSIGGDAPVNDNCADAIEAVPGVYSYNTSFATTDGAAGCGFAGDPGSNDVWYKITADRDGLLVIGTCGSSFDTILSAYDGCGGSELGCNDDSCGGTLQSQIAVNVTSGQEVYARVSGYGTASGAGTIEFTLLDPCNLSQPSGAFMEPEDCGGDVNGGCNDAELRVTSVNVDTVIWGSAWADADMRDTDWYEFTLSEARDLNLSITAGFGARIILLSADCPTPTQYGTAFTTFPCEEGTFSTFLEAGTYRVFAGANAFAGTPCGQPGTGNNYVLTIGDAPTGCPADFNGDGFMDFFDYDDYVNCFETGNCPAGRDADFNGDDFVDFFDYDDFVSAFETGC